MPERKTKRTLSFFDALLFANGIVSSIYESGLSGIRLPLLHLLFFLSICIVGCGGVILILNAISDYLPQNERRIYLFVTAANILPVVVIAVKHLGR